MNVQKRRGRGRGSGNATGMQGIVGSCNGVAHSVRYDNGTGVLFEGCERRLLEYPPQQGAVGKRE